ncbi:hypothetical protein E2542_SST15273 [Spatholobus suberectus]|nr:hypothetical protein E2542_SST15273 [Spatholobus suberectus]
MWLPNSIFPLTKSDTLAGVEDDERGSCFGGVNDSTSGNGVLECLRENGKCNVGGGGAGSCGDHDGTSIGGGGGSDDDNVDGGSGGNGGGDGDDVSNDDGGVDGSGGGNSGSGGGDDLSSGNGDSSDDNSGNGHCQM